MTCPFSPQISLIRAISFGMNDSCDQLDRRSKAACSHHAPSSSDTTDVVDEASDDLLALRTVRHLGVELHAVDGLGLVGDGGVWGSRGRSDGEEVGRERRELVAVAHPDLQSTVLLHRDALEELVGRRARLLDRDLGVSVLPVRVRLDITAVRSGDLLQTVADTHDGHAGLEDRGVDVRGVVGVDRVGRAREDDTCA